MENHLGTKGTIAVRTFPRQKLVFEKEIGSGSFGNVYKATIKDPRIPGVVAVKVFSQDLAIDSTVREKALDELTKVAVLDHENIVRLLGMVEDGIPWLVFEYMKDGNLLEYVMQKKEAKERTLVKYCRDICNGMTFIHRNNFLHKDLAARNILLDGKMAKIADLGLCSFLSEEHDGSYALGGKLFPYRHAAAECVVECIYTFESDVWSFGVLLCEIFTSGAVPYGKENKQPEVRRFIADGMSPLNFQEPVCSDEIRSIMNSIFYVKREDRPSFIQLSEQFEILLGGQSRKIPRPKRDPSPFRAHHHQHQRLQDVSIMSSHERLAPISPTSSTQHLGLPDRRSSHTSSSPDIHAALSKPIPPARGRSRPMEIIRDNKDMNLLHSPTPSSYGDRRYSEIPEWHTESSNRRPDLLYIDQEQPPRRTASFSNISRPEGFRTAAEVEQNNNIFKGLIPNRFGNKKL